MKYYTDKEIIERIENYGESSDDSVWLANIVRERFEQKDGRIYHLQELVRVAAEHIGRGMIYDLHDEEC